MKDTLQVGMTGEHRQRVVSAHLVSHYVEGGPPVFGSPFMLFAMECAAGNILLPHMEPGEQSVGVGFDFQHLAATPAGANVTARAEVVEIAGKRVVFRIEAHDEHEQIGAGTHSRFVVQMDRFLERLKKKAGD